jgi:hypothetical protein
MKSVKAFSHPNSELKWLKIHDVGLEKKISPYTKLLRNTF